MTRAPDTMLRITIAHDAQTMQWVAHDIRLDIVSQGRTEGEALRALAEAIEMCITDDLSRGLDPYDRESKP